MAIVVDAVWGSPTAETVVERCAVQRLKMGAWVYMVRRTPARAHQESRFTAACKPFE